MSTLKFVKFEDWFLNFLKDRHIEHHTVNERAIAEHAWNASRHDTQTQIAELVEQPTVYAQGAKQLADSIRFLDV